MRPEEGEKGIQGLQYDWCQLVWAPTEFHLHQQHRPGFKRTVQIPKRNKNWIETHPWRNKTVQPLKLSWLFPHLVLVWVAWFPFTLCWWREYFPGDCHVERNSKRATYAQNSFTQNHQTFRPSLASRQLHICTIVILHPAALFKMGTRILQFQQVFWPGRE
jgi:hypothetical protein